MKPVYLIVIALIALNVLVFAQLASHSFVNYDDGEYIYRNANVKAGLSGPSLAWAMTATQSGWFPLTWISHMTDASVWGLRAGAHLLTNLALHIISTLLLFFALYRMTGAIGRSAFVAALFAIHPMHVESVAWASERKDTLSTLFAILALLFYARRRMVLVAIAMALSLLAKQTYVTLPFVLLLLDDWPLRRTRNVKEKVPLFALTILGSIAAVAGQRSMNAIQSVESLPIGDRLANAALAYVRYLGKLVWPDNLSVIYPMHAISMPVAAGAFVLLALITAGAFAVRKRFPYVLTGWLWFTGTLVPVIGIVQIGGQAMADRYTYFAYIGLFLIVAWGAVDIANALLVPRRVLAAIAMVVISAFAYTAWRQAATWKNTETLFTQALEATGQNPLADYSLAHDLELRDPDRAIEHYKSSIASIEAAARANPDAPIPSWYSQSYGGIGASLIVLAQKKPRAEEQVLLLDNAIVALSKAIQLDPRAENAQRNLALARQLKANAAPRVDPRQQ
ncbi:MAG TPA: hypothetical protein VN181_15025, partial [Thermoanaerobaculia bacterium]|nr:hypothetical protein [Thermoanaerobaculia bacterium]